MGSSRAMPAKQVKLSIRIWAWFSGVGFIGLVLAMVGFAYLFRQSVYAVAVSGNASGAAFVRFRRRAGPLDINCEEVGVADKYIPPTQQYHPVSTQIENQEQCRSRFFQHCFWSSDTYTPTASFFAALRSYEQHHRNCIVGYNLTHHALRGSTPRGCRYITWRDLDGKGNQLISLVSAFIYALLTDRVLLITQGAGLQHLLCEPFPRSSWVLPDDFPDDLLRNEAERHSEFYGRAWNTSASKSHKLELPKQLQIGLSNYRNPLDMRFFCEGDQKLVKKVPWLFFRSNQYSVPGLYFVPSFRATLNEWFPDRAVFLHAGRYLLSPRDNIWGRIFRIYRSYMATADRRLGIQVRAWRNNYTSIISDHILACAIHTGLLPNVTSSNESLSRAGAIDNRDREHIAVVLGSLRREYADALAETFAESEPMDGERVTVLSPSAEGQQKMGDIEHDERGIADMWLLSFTDDMISTPRSTFGYVAHGLAGIKPIVFNRYGLDQDQVPNPPCWRTNLPGPCFIDHPENIECPLDGYSMGDGDVIQPEVRRCILQWGIGVFEGD